jgi:NAD(P)-dependent dehydrogenase (short-subunit alcohol dehydrogenase family)
MSVFGSLDIVISNAGIMNDRFWELEVDVNLVSQIIMYMYIIYTYIYIQIHMILSFVFCLHALILFTLYLFLCSVMFTVTQITDLQW